MFELRDKLTTAAEIVGVPLLIGGAFVESVAAGIASVGGLLIYLAAVAR